MQKLKNILARVRQFTRQAGGKLTNDIAIEDLMRFFRADEHGHEASIVKADLGYGWLHYAFIRQLKPQRVLCIGSRYGYIPAVLAQACKDNGSGHVDFVDAGYDGSDPDGWTGEGYWRTPQGQSSFRRFGLDRFITLFVMTTREFARRHPKTRYDYIYIDGNHSLKGATFDYRTFLPRLRVGGLMGFHDISVKGNLPEGPYGVWKLWQKISRNKAISINNPISGLGLLQK